jgi:folate-binding protein YgfZ
MISTASQDTLIPTHMGDYAGMATIADFGDVPAEFEALLTKCGVYELQWRTKVSLTGSDRVRWLNGIITNNVRDLPAGAGVYAFMLNPQGRILGDLYAYNRGDSLLVDIDRFQLPKVLALFDRYIIMDDVEVSDITSKLSAVGITGPEARGALRAAGIDFPELPSLSFVDMIWRDVSLTVVRNDAPSIESYEMWTSPENANLLRDALETSGAMKVGTTALNLLRIAQGIPQYGQDIRERELPQETEQNRALHFTKGCYIGQEIVERIRSRGNVHRKFTGFNIDGPLPPPGTKILVDGKEVGEITSSASLPLSTGYRQVGLGYIRREAVVPDRAIQIDGTKLNVTALPFSEVFKR